MKYILQSLYFSFFTFCFIYPSCAQPLHQKQKFTSQDTLRGSITPERAWWDVVHYSLTVTPDYRSKTIKGFNRIIFKVTEPGINKVMQIDMQQPMQIEKVFMDQSPIDSIRREGNAYFIYFGKRHFIKRLDDTIDNHYQIDIVFSGTPREAKNAPWDGGWIWKQDAQGRPWMTVACQGLGASVWYPCKDHQSDEPDNGASITVTIPDSLVAVANGRLKQNKSNNNGTASWTWEVKNPINNYNIVPYIGKYVNWKDNYIGETEKNLTLDYWVLDYNLDKAKKQFEQVKPMLKCFEYWFGPYPFYEDGYKLVESSHLGMEHQSAVAYGNKYQNGYLGKDLSGSGWGNKWDFIIVHESGHEWFANNITTKDIADMWVHEGFTSYSETLFTECEFGKEAANAYCQGLRKNITNDRPVIGLYGVNQEGSGDMYYKGSNMLHTIRQVINDDEKFRKILRGLNETFFHETVTSKEVEDYMAKNSGKNLAKIFDQYLRTTKIPELEYKINGHSLYFRWINCVDGFDMPVRFANSERWLDATTNWKHTEIKETMNEIEIDPNFYISIKNVKM